MGEHGTDGHDPKTETSIWPSGMGNDLMHMRELAPFVRDAFQKRSSAAMTLAFRDSPSGVLEAIVFVHDPSRASEVREVARAVQQDAGAGRLCQFQFPVLVTVYVGPPPFSRT